MYSHELTCYAIFLALLGYAIINYAELKTIVRFGPSPFSSFASATSTSTKTAPETAATTAAAVAPITLDDFTKRNIIASGPALTDIDLAMIVYQNREDLKK